MSIAMISFLVGLLFLLICAYIQSLFTVEKLDLLGRVDRDQMDRIMNGRGQYRPSNSRFGRFYGRYMEATFGARIERFAKIAGLSMENLESMIALAGMTEKVSAIEIVALKVIGLISLPLIGIPAYLSGEMTVMLGAFVLFTALYLLPESKVKDAVNERKEAVMTELPAFIEQIYLCIEAGSNLKPALEVVSDRFGGEIGAMFQEAMTMSLFTGSWEKELIKKCEQLHVEPLEEFVTDILNANEKGISISETLRNEVRHIGIVNRSRIREATSKLDATMTIPIMIFFVLPMVGIVMIPVGIQLMQALA